MEPSKYQYCTAYKVKCTSAIYANLRAKSKKKKIFLLKFSSGLSHLAVSNSTPPPSTSPIQIKVKSEPVSPPRDHHLAHTQSTPGLSITTMNNATSNISVLSHPQQHLIMSSRPSSTGHLTPTPGTLDLPSMFCFGYFLFIAICNNFILFVLFHYLLIKDLLHRRMHHHQAIYIDTIVIYMIMNHQISHINDQEYRKVGPHSPLMITIKTI